MKSVCDVTNPYNTVGIYEMRGRRMVVDIWHLILLADITVCYCKSITITMGDPAGHTLAGNILDANKMCV